MIDFIRRWGGQRSGISQLQIVGWVGIGRSKFYDWRARYGKANEHHAWIPRDHWIEDWERQRIVKFAQEFPLEGYRRLTFMMLDRDLVAVSPSTTYRVLKAAGLIETWNRKPSQKGSGFVQPLAPHEHWHVDVCSRLAARPCGLRFAKAISLRSVPTSTWPAHSTTSAPCSTAARARSSTTSCANP